MPKPVWGSDLLTGLEHTMEVLGSIHRASVIHVRLLTVVCWRLSSCSDPFGQGQLNLARRVTLLAAGLGL